MWCCTAYVSKECVVFQCQWSMKNAKIRYVTWTDQQWLDGKSGQASREVWRGPRYTSRPGPKKGQDHVCSGGVITDQWPGGELVGSEWQPKWVTQLAHISKVLPGSSFMEAILNLTTPLLVTGQWSALPHFPINSSSFSVQPLLVRPQLYIPTTKPKSGWAS